MVRGRDVGGTGKALAQAGAGPVQERLPVVVGAQGLPVLPVPLLLSGVAVVVSVRPGVSGAPGVLVEQ